MSEHRYILEPYKGMKTRYRCPGCNKDKRFSLYIDSETGEHLHHSVGRCDRESNCGYHYTPKQYFRDNNISDKKTHPRSCTKPKVINYPQKQISFIQEEVFKKSLQIGKNIGQVAEVNNFVKFLTDLLGDEESFRIITEYFIGTSKYWDGSTVFWQIDITGKIRTGKIMLYNSTTGKRVKEPFNHINWVHKALKTIDFELKQCFFGEHLLRDKTKPVAIVESEKTAVIASAYMPEFIWLAAGSLTNLNAERCQVLKDRDVILFPDLNGFEKWNTKAKGLTPLANFTISGLLENKTSEAEKKQGFDLADYLVKYSLNDFSINSSEPEAKSLDKSFMDVEKTEAELWNHNSTVTEPIIAEKQPRVFIQSKRKTAEPETSQPVNWTRDIEELEKFFSETQLPSTPIKLNRWTTITSVSKCIESDLAIVKNYNGKPAFKTTLDHLKELKEFLSNLN